MKIVTIAALARDNVIGFQNNIPWKNKEDLQFFKNTTEGFPVIMGRKTFESLKSPLKNRLNIVISKNYENLLVECYNTFESAILDLKKTNIEKCFIIGGSSIYSQFINYSDELLLSYIFDENNKYLDVKGDMFFPKINMSIWKLNNIRQYKTFELKHYLKR